MRHRIFTREPGPGLLYSIIQYASENANNFISVGVINFLDQFISIGATLIGIQWSKRKNFPLL